MGLGGGPPPPLLEVRGLCKTYAPGDPPALDGVSLTVHEGEFVAVLGSSGAGKSTLLRCINRLVEPAAGHIAWLGRDVRALDAEGLRVYRRQIGMIFQEFHLLDRLTVLSNVLVGRFGYASGWRALCGRWSPADLRRAGEALERVGLAGLAGRRARELSGGQRQRVAIARALVQEPRLILADEPVSNLDPATARQVVDLLAAIHRRDGIALLVNLHDVGLAARYAGRIVGLARGRVVFEGSPSDLDEQALARIYGPEAPAAPRSRRGERGPLPEASPGGKPGCT